MVMCIWHTEARWTGHRWVNETNEVYQVGDINLIYNHDARQIADIVR